MKEYYTKLLASFLGLFYFKMISKNILIHNLPGEEKIPACIWYKRGFSRLLYKDLVFNDTVLCFESRSHFLVRIKTFFRRCFRMIKDDIHSLLRELP